MGLLESDAGDSVLFTNLLLVSILFIFASAIIGTIVARRNRDRCLKLFDDYHVTLARAGGRVIWGDLRVFSQGIEVEYDAPGPSQPAALKTSYLLYQHEMEQVVAFCRYVGHLTEDELRTRRHQVEVRFRPGLMRRGRRSVVNVVNTVRDAFAQAMSAVTGQLAKVGGKSSVASSQKGEMEKVGKLLLGTVGNAYEPMLERQIGKPVVIEMASSAVSDGGRTELCGYLAEYSDKYLAVFNVEQPAQETFSLPCDESLEQDGVMIEVGDAGVRVTNTSPVPLVVDAVLSDQGEPHELGVVLSRGSIAELPGVPGRMSVRLLRVERIDVVCHRKWAIIRHASFDERLPAV
jgi:hypothetical protein